MIVMTGTRVMIVTSVMNVIFVMIVMFDCHFYRFFNVKILSAVELTFSHIK